MTSSSRSIVGPNPDTSPRRHAAKRPSHYPRRKPERGAGLEGVSVLVVEDDDAGRKLLALVLTGAGALVTAVRTAEEALAAVLENPPRIVVLDLVLPRMSGLVLVEKLRGAPETRHIVIVAVTSLNGPAVEKMVLAAGCAAYVRKPIDTMTFAATIAKCVRGKA